MPAIFSRQARPSAATTARRYVLFFKPYNVLSTFTDPEGRPTLADHVPVPDIYAAGRLDYDSEGLLLLTDDGDLAHRLTDPRHKLPKTYLVQVENVPSAEAVAALRTGVTVKGELLAAAEVELLPVEPDLPPRSVPIRYRPTIPTAWLRIVLHEGKKRQIRHMTAAAGHPTLRLVRVAIGPLSLAGLQPGQWRDLTAAELQALKGALNRGRVDDPGNPAPHGLKRPFDRLRGGADRRRPDRQLPAPHPGARPGRPAAQQRDRGQPGRADDRRRVGSRTR